MPDARFGRNRTIDIVQRFARSRYQNDHFLSLPDAPSRLIIDRPSARVFESSFRGQG